MRAALLNLAGAAGALGMAYHVVTLVHDTVLGLAAGI